MLKNAIFRLFIYRLNIALRRHKRQTWNGYFLLSEFLNCSEREHEVMKECFVLFHFKVTSSNVRHQRSCKKDTWVAFCSSIFQQYFGMVLLPPNYASDRVMHISRKSIKVTVTSNVGNCDFRVVRGVAPKTFKKIEV